MHRGCLRGRRAEDGRLHSCYQLRETERDRYRYRQHARRNVIDSSVFRADRFMAPQIRRLIATSGTTVGSKLSDLVPVVESRLAERRTWRCWVKDSHAQHRRT